MDGKFERNKTLKETTNKHMNDFIMISFNNYVVALLW